MFEKRNSLLTSYFNEFNPHCMIVMYSKESWTLSKDSFNLLILNSHPSYTWRWWMKSDPFKIYRVQFRTQVQTEMQNCKFATESRSRLSVFSLQKGASYSSTLECPKIWAFKFKLLVSAAFGVGELEAENSQFPTIFPVFLSLTTTLTLSQSMCVTHSLQRWNLYLILSFFSNNFTWNQNRGTAHSFFLCSIWLVLRGKNAFL